MYIPYNAYKLNGPPKLKYADMIKKGIWNSPPRFELHRVWQVEATLKGGMSHVMPKRVFYLDEDSGLVALADGYDGRGGLWRVFMEPLLQAYEVPLMFQSRHLVHDLNNGNFIAMMLMNERKVPGVQMEREGQMGGLPSGFDSP